MVSASDFGSFRGAARTLKYFSVVSLCEIPSDFQVSKNHAILIGL
jgi:hypothetical protein